MALVIGRPDDIPVYIDPNLNIGNVPALIEKEVRRVMRVMEIYDREHITNAEAYTCYNVPIAFPEPNSSPRFRIRFHYCCGAKADGTGWNEEYRIVKEGHLGFRLKHCPKAVSDTPPCR